MDKSLFPKSWRQPFRPDAENLLPSDADRALPFSGLRLHLGLGSGRLRPSTTCWAWNRGRGRRLRTFHALVPFTAAGACPPFRATTTKIKHSPRAGYPKHRPEQSPLTHLPLGAKCVKTSAMLGPGLTRGGDPQGAPWSNPPYTPTP